MDSEARDQDEEDAPPPDPSEEDSGTMFIARELQKPDAAPEHWAAMLQKVEKALKESRGGKKLPGLFEFDDFRQIVWLRLLSLLPNIQLRSREELWAYVKKVAEHIEIDLARRAAARKRNPDERETQQGSADGTDRLAQAADDDAWTASTLARVAEIEQRELDCVAKVPQEEHRDVYLKRRRDGKSFEEIAREVGRNKTVTVRVIYKRTREKVVACLKDGLDGYTSILEGGD